MLSKINSYDSFQVENIELRKITKMNRCFVRVSLVGWSDITNKDSTFLHIKNVYNNTSNCQLREILT